MQIYLSTLLMYSLPEVSFIHHLRRDYPYEAQVISKFSLFSLCPHNFHLSEQSETFNKRLLRFFQSVLALSPERFKSSLLSLTVHSSLSSDSQPLFLSSYSARTDTQEFSANPIILFSFLSFVFIFLGICIFFHNIYWVTQCYVLAAL